MLSEISETALLRSCLGVSRATGSAGESSSATPRLAALATDLQIAAAGTKRDRKSRYLSFDRDCNSPQG